MRRWATKFFGPGPTGVPEESMVSGIARLLKKTYDGPSKEEVEQQEKLLRHFTSEEVRRVKDSGKKIYTSLMDYGDERASMIQSQVDERTIIFNNDTTLQTDLNEERDKLQKNFDIAEKLVVQLGDKLTPKQLEQYSNFKDEFAAVKSQLEGGDEYIQKQQDQITQVHQETVQGLKDSIAKVDSLQSALADELVEKYFFEAEELLKSPIISPDRKKIYSGIFNEKFYKELRPVLSTQEIGKFHGKIIDAYKTLQAEVEQPAPEEEQPAQPTKPEPVKKRELPVPIDQMGPVFKQMLEHPNIPPQIREKYSGIDLKLGRLSPTQLSRLEQAAWKFIAKHKETPTPAKLLIIIGDLLSHVDANKK